MPTTINSLLVFKARDNSGFVIYDKYSGETKFFENEEDIISSYSQVTKDSFTKND